MFRHMVIPTIGMAAECGFYQNTITSATPSLLLRLIAGCLLFFFLPRRGLRAVGGRGQRVLEIR